MTGKPGLDLAERYAASFIEGERAGTARHGEGVSQYLQRISGLSESSSAGDED